MRRFAVGFIVVWLWSGLVYSSDRNSAVSRLTRQAPVLSDVWFTGHLNPDTDSIISAIAAAELFGGVAARTGDLNPESTWLLNKFSLPVPELLKDGEGKKFFLLDFNQSTQAPPFITPEKILGIIDHHALRGSPFSLNLPTEILIRPWGSTCTILTYLFQEYEKPVPPGLAGGLLGGILSDTMNLKSPTTTEFDRKASQYLASVAKVDDTQALAQALLLARSDLKGKTPGEILLLDFKEYRLGDKKAGFGVAESVHPESLIKMKDDLISEMAKHRSRTHLDYMFFIIVDSLKLKSYLLVPEGEEATLSERAFRGVFKDRVMDLGSRVSRKKEIVPALQMVMQKDSA